MTPLSAAEREALVREMCAAFVGNDVWLLIDEDTKQRRIVRMRAALAVAEKAIRAEVLREVRSAVNSKRDGANYAGQAVAYAYLSGVLDFIDERLATPAPPQPDTGASWPDPTEDEIQEARHLVHGSWDLEHPDEDLPCEYGCPGHAMKCNREAIKVARALAWRRVHGTTPPAPAQPDTGEVCGACGHAEHVGVCGGGEVQGCMCGTQVAGTGKQPGDTK